MIKRYYLRHVFIFCFGLLLMAGNAPAGDIGAAAEWDPAKLILMHTPGDEIFFGVIHPAAALYEKPFNPQKAQEQHLNYIRLLEDQGIKTIGAVDTLLKGTVDKNGNPIPGKELDDLREFASDFLTIDASGLSTEKQTQLQKYIFCMHGQGLR